jgi:ribonuclease P protein component
VAVQSSRHVAPKVVQNSLSNKPVATLTPAHRLLRKDRFDHVIRSDSVADKYFKVFYIGNDGKNGRLGIIASKRSFPRAVDRNRAKRLVREAFRQHGIKFQKLDLVVLVKNTGIQDTATGSEKLNTLFGRIEDRCAKS